MPGPTIKIAYFDCFSGASGDMLLGSLVDAGLPLGDLVASLARLKIGGYRLVAEPVTRHGLSGTHLQVIVEPGERPARTLPAIERIIGNSDLPERVRDLSLAVFRRLAQAEAAVHGTTIDQVHFHEIGAVDSLVDIVGFVWALEHLGIEDVHCSALTLGGGTVQTEHGRLPAPAPATLALLAEVGAPTVPGPARTELLTPTGAALLTEFATFERTPMTVEAVGYGFGTKEFAWPNALRVWLGE
ncbi:MAG: LarC family nickel insertion protein, partial [Anaerolineae bacterium]